MQSFLINQFKPMMESKLTFTFDSNYKQDCNSNSVANIHALLWSFDHSGPMTHSRMTGMIVFSQGWIYSKKIFQS